MAFSAGQYAWVVLTIFLAYFVRGMSGFGACMIAVPLMVLVMPLPQAVSLCSLLAFTLFIGLLARDRHLIDWGELKRLIPSTLIGTALALWLFSVLDNKILVTALGVFLIVYAIYMLVASLLKWEKLRCGPLWAWPAGGVGSFFDTLFGGGGGTLVVIYINARGVARAAFRITVVALWFVELLARIAGYAWAGFYSQGTLMLFAALLPVVWAATVVGEKLGNRLDGEMFSRLVAVMLAASGVSLLAR